MVPDLGREEFLAGQLGCGRLGHVVEKERKENLEPEEGMLENQEEAGAKGTGRVR